jgi:uncharacterized protein
MVPEARWITFRAVESADGGAPLLSGRLRLPDGEPVGGAVLSHPHPAFGGNMDVWLLPHLSQALAAQGWAVLRYDVRGVGRSEGGPGRWDGALEHHDLGGAVARIRQELPAGARVALVGWSFGALLGMLHGPLDPAVTDWVGIAPPTRSLPGVPMAAPDLAALRGWRARRSVIVGSHDQFFPATDAALLSPHEVHVVADADHFLFDRDEEIAVLVAQCLHPEGGR